MSFWSTAALDKTKYFHDFEDNIAVLCAKKVLKGPFDTMDTLNMPELEKLLHCRSNLMRVFHFLAPIVMKKMPDSAEKKPEAQESSEETAESEE